MSHGYGIRVEHAFTLCPKVCVHLIITPIQYVPQTVASTQIGSTQLYRSSLYAVALQVHENAPV